MLKSGENRILFVVLIIAIMAVQISYADIQTVETQKFSRSILPVYCEKCEDVNVNVFREITIYEINDTKLLRMTLYLENKLNKENMIQFTDGILEEITKNVTRDVTFTSRPLAISGNFVTWEMKLEPFQNKTVEYAVYINNSTDAVQLYSNPDFKMFTLSSEIRKIEYMNTYVQIAIIIILVAICIIFALRIKKHHKYKLNMHELEIIKRRIERGGKRVYFSSHEDKE